MKTKIKIAVIAMIGMYSGVKAQGWDSNGNNSSTGKLTLDGSSININTPITTGGWARGINNMATDKSTRIGGIGLLGSGESTIKYYYMAHGITPYSSGLGLYIKPNGNTGIGTVNPSAKVEIKSNETKFVKFNREGVAKKGHIGYGADNEGGVYLGTDDNQYALWVQQNGSIGVGTTNPKGKLNISSSSTIGWSNLGGASILLGSETSGLGIDKNEIASKGDNLYIGTIDVNRSIYFRTGGTSTRMFIDGSDGNVGIGTTTTGSHKLAVEGSIGAREIKVEGSGWSDFVFEKSYKLPSLENVEKHIEEKGHLQDIPSAKEVEKNGFYLGEMDAKLLQKIEELTLYTIKQEKEIKELKKQNSKIEKLEEENKLLKSLLKRVSKLEEKIK